MVLTDCLDAFLFSKEIAGLSPKSIINYRDFVSPFCKFYHFDISLLSIDDVNSFFLSLLHRDISKSTYATYVRNIKIFLVWCVKQYDLKIDAASIKVPKSPKKNLYIYSDDDIRCIFDTVLSDSWLSVRNACLISLMLDSGLRQSECVTLSWNNVFIESNYLNVFGKGDKERIVPLGKLSKEFLLQYVDMCPYKSTRVFVTRLGDNITNNTMKLMISKYAKMLPFEFSCHKLRHNFATNFLIDSYEHKGYMDIFALMAILGHENIETTKRYLHVANQVVYSRAHISHLDAIFKSEPTR